MALKEALNWIRRIIIEEDVVVLVGCKSDLVTDDSTEVTKQEISELTCKHNMKYLEVSNKMGQNVQETVQILD